MRRRLVAAALLAAALPAGGCEFDMTRVPERLPTPAHLSLQLDVRERGGPLEIRAAFHPGTDHGRVPREVTDDSLRLDGLAVAPTEVSYGLRHYLVRGLDASTPALRVRPPAVAGEPPPEVVVEPIRIDAPDTLVASRTDVLEIRLTGLDQARAEERGSWWAYLFSGPCSGEPILVLSGPGVPPPLLRLPAALLPPDATLGHVRYTGAIWREVAGTAGSYEVEVSRTFNGCIPLRLHD